MAVNKLSNTRKPDEISLNEWQTELRKQFAPDQKFKFKNTGDNPVYSDFEIFNPQTGKKYKVSIRDNVKSYNYCSCPDFKINGLGTCKHVEYMLHYFSSYKKYRKYFGKPHVPKYSSLSIFYGNERKVWFRKAVSANPIPGEKELFDNDGFLISGKLPELQSFIDLALKLEPGFRVYPDVFEKIELDRKNRERDQITRQLFVNGTDSEIFDGLIQTALYPYQKEGIRRIVETRRILLADEMGLGKTVQTIASLEVFSRYLGVNSVLIVCPTSLKYQWKNEINKFTGRHAIIIEGSPLDRSALYAEKTFYKIISYGACCNDTDKINQLKPDLVIIDEAQRIKNWKTKTARAVKSIQSDFAIVLTGTPLENRIDELHSLMEFVDQYKLGPLFRFLGSHQVLDGKGKLTGYKNLREIYKTLDDVLLRRNRQAIIDQLPGRIDKNYYIEMTREQAEEHEYYYNTVTRLVNLWVYQGFLSDEDREKLLMSLNCMRMVCDSTYILKRNTNHGNKINELEDLIGDLLQDSGNRIVIFSQWKRMFELVIGLLEKKNLPFLYLNGDIEAKKRKEIIEEFQSGEKVKIFLSTDAGGIGVNLQSANIIINLDLPWNPAVLDQRIGRIYRLGQKKHIRVYNFIAYNSIEHRILYLLDFKRAVFNGVLEPEGNDEVMLEGFMESVRAITGVVLNHKEKSAFAEKITSDAGTENLRVENIESGSVGTVNADLEASVNNPDLQDNTSEKTKKNGFFGKIRDGIISLLKLFSKNQQ
jgi:SNF2 family DNA or RNA helicase